MSPALVVTQRGRRTYTMLLIIRRLRVRVRRFIRVRPFVECRHAAAPHRRCVCVAAEEAACRVRPVRFVRAATGRDERHEERTSCEVRGVVVVLLPPLPAFALSARLSPDARLVSLRLSQGAPPAFPIISHTWVGRFLGRAARTVAKISLSSASPSPSFTHPFSLFLPASRAPQRRYERAARTATTQHGQWSCFPARARALWLARSVGWAGLAGLVGGWALTNHVFAHVLT